MADTPLASLSLTHVHYNPRDPLSYLSAYLALLPQGLCIVYATLLVSTREIEILFAFGGQLVCEGLNWALKRLIKEERPERVRVLGKGYGMPSSHAQFVGFWSVYVVLWLWVRFKPRRKVERGMMDPMKSFVGGMNGFAGTASKGVEEGASPASEKKKSKEKEREKDKSRDKEKERDKDKEREKDRDREKDKDVDEDKENKKHKKRKSDGADGKAPASPTTPNPDSDLITINTNHDRNLSSLSPAGSPTPPSSVSPAYALQLHHPHLTKAFLSLVLLSTAFFVSVSRIYLSYHTARQVYIGYLIGAIFASTWFVVTEVARRLGYVDLLLDHPLLRLYRVRDLCCDEDLVELSWGVWEQKRKLRRRMRRKSVRFAGLPREEEEEEGKAKGRKGKEDGKKGKRKS